MGYPNRTLAEATQELEANARYDDDYNPDQPNWDVENHMVLGEEQAY